MGGRRDPDVAPVSGASANAWLRRLRTSVLLGMLAVAVPAAAMACDAVTPCEVKNGFYFVRTPAGWDGKSPLPTAVFFHGYRGTAKDVMADDGLGKTLSDLGVALIAPNGNDMQWSYPSKLHGARNDFEFVAAVLDDAERRLPIDRSRLWATGFSIGGSMTWYLSCYLGSRFAAFAPIAGAYWDPMPTTCPSGPVSLRHIHGTADQTVPMKGRTVGSGFRQGDVVMSVEHLLQRDGCPAQPTSTTQVANKSCRTWSAGACSSHREVVLCLHPGEHEIEPAWVAEDYAWVDGLARSGTKSAARK